MSGDRIDWEQAFSRPRGPATNPNQSSGLRKSEGHIATCSQCEREFRLKWRVRPGWVCWCCLPNPELAAAAREQRRERRDDSTAEKVTTPPVPYNEFPPGY